MGSANDKDFSYENMDSIMGGLADGFVLTDRQGMVLYMNAAAQEIFQYTFDRYETVEFKELCHLVNLETGEKYFCPISRAMKDDRNIGLSKNIGIYHGEKKVFLSATCSPRHDSEGRVIGCSAIFRDISRLHDMSHKLETDKYYMQSVFEAAKIGICSLNVKTQVVDINEAALEILGSTYMEAIGQQMGEIFQCVNCVPYGCGNGDKCKFCIVRNNMNAAIMDDSFSADFVATLVSKKSQDPIWLQFFLTQVWKENDKQVVLTFIDISRRKQRERELLEARRMAEAASNTKTQFLANMSHEIRTPINGMTGMINLTLMSDLTEEQRSNLQLAKQCSEDLLRIINDILDYAKLENGKMTIERIGMDLPALLERVGKIHGNVIRGKGLEFIVRVDENLPKFICGDPLRLRQILHNLLSNALKFTVQGSITVGARVVRRGIRQVLEFYVEDTGIGMNTRQQEKLFKPFSQVDGSTTRKFGGTGLGLMIVKELVTAMGGEISVISRPGEGSRFTFTIPLELAEKAETELKDQTVFMNPYKNKGAGNTDKLAEEQKQLPDAEDVAKGLEKSENKVQMPKLLSEEPDDDIMDLLKYCQEKLNS